MNLRKLAIHVAMWLLGAAAFAAFAWLVQWSDGTPVRVPGTAEVPAAAADEPLAALTAGVARTAWTARRHLATGTRSEAAHAIDAAARAAEVGHETSHGAVKEAFAVALQRLHETRESLHLGRPGAAADDLDVVVERLGEAVGASRAMSAGVPPAEVRAGYEGAVLLNANGSMVGQVQRIEEGADGPTAVVRLGGANDVLGFLEFGGRTARFPADRLLWGPRRSLGSVLVALPTESSDPGAIVEALG